jgi:hypothetical protein
LLSLKFSALVSSSLSTACAFRRLQSNIPNRIPIAKAPPTPPPIPPASAATLVPEEGLFPGDELAEIIITVVTLGNALFEAISLVGIVVDVVDENAEDEAEGA